MKTFEEITKSLSAEYSLRTRELRVFCEGKIVVRTVVPKSDESDFWHGEVIDGIDVDFNLCKAEEGERSYFLCVYRVIDGKTITDKHVEVKLYVLTTYWCVATTIGDRGHVVCNLIGSREYEERPEQSCHHFSSVDRYIDFFDTEQEALQFIAQSKNA